MSIKCPKCATVNTGDQTTCIGCGHKLKKGGGGIGMIMVAVFDFLTKWMGRVAVIVLVFGAVAWWLYRQHMPTPEEGVAGKAASAMQKLRSTLAGEEGAAGGTAKSAGADGANAQGAEEGKGAAAEPDAKLIETLKMRLDPSRLRSGHEAEIYLQNGESDKGKLFKATEHHVTIAVGGQLRGYYPDDIRVIVQGYPLALADSEKAKCLARLKTSCLVRPAAGEAPRRLAVRVNNASKYAFRGTVVLKDPSGAGDDISVDLTRGVGVAAGKFLSVEIPLSEDREVGKLQPVFEGEFCDTVEVKPFEKTVLEKVPVVEQKEGTEGDQKRE